MKRRHSYAGLERTVRERTHELERTKAKDEAILLGIGDALVVTDPAGRIALTNRAFKEMLGWREAEVRGKLLTDVVPSQGEHGTPIPPARRALLRALRSGKKVRSLATETHYYRHRNGSWVPVNITVTPVLLQGKLIGAIEIFRDITSEKAIDQVKTEFVSLASHELRTPLTTIKWYAERLLDGGIGKLSLAQHQHLLEIYQANQQMIELVNALLNVSRLELGTFMLEPRPTDVRTLVRQIIVELQPQLTAKTLRLEQRYAKVPRLLVDRNLLRIVVRNLLVNAVKYTPSSGRVKFAVVTRRLGDSFGGRAVKQPCLAITVADSGYGIPRDQQSRVFSKLFRADNISQQEANGYGLGLYTVKLILAHVGGQIWFKSVEHKGTIFFVILPFAGMKPRGGSRRLKTESIN